MARKSETFEIQVIHNFTPLIATTSCSKSKSVMIFQRSQMKAKFNWGGNGATLGRMRLLKIMLPTDEKGEPDYEFMEHYVSEKWGAYYAL